MYKLICAIIIFLMLTTPAMAEDTWTGPDKVMHLAAGAWLGFVGFGARDIYDPNASTVAKWETGLLLGTTVGAIKELSDMSSPGNHFCGKDLVVTAIGAGLGAGLGVMFNYTSDSGNETAMISKQWSW